MFTNVTWSNFNFTPVYNVSQIESMEYKQMCHKVYIWSASNVHRGT